MRLLIIDTAQIQSYVFGGNRLRENIGASYQVAAAAGAWALAALPQPNNVADANRLTLTNERWIERDNLQAELLYVGGGNIVALLADETAARNFTRAYSRDLLKRAPGLQAIFWHGPFSWEDSLYEAVQEGFRQLAQKKRRRAYAAPLLGLGVTEMCRSTAFPAVGQSESESEPYPISREAQAKEAAYSQANKRLEAYMAAADNYLDGYQFPYDFDNLGRSEGEQSYIAIVHADGDGMGSRFREIGRGLSNRDYIKATRELSRAVDQASQAALQNTLRSLIDKLQTRDRDILAHRSAFGDIIAEVVLQEAPDDGYYLPFRPIVFGGDDVTFVCDGRLGLSLALEYMDQFAQATADMPGGRITASAGVVIVKSHYPFAQAYGICEELTQSAKKYRREKDLDACLDWHFARSGIMGSLQKTRQREYETAHGSLILRPVTLAANPQESHRAWPVVQAGLVAFQDLERRQREPGWSSRRGKVKALRERLREGEAAVRQFRAKFNNEEPLPAVCDSMANWPTTGWQGGFCGYFDAIEAMDWFIPLRETAFLLTPSAKTALGKIEGETA